MEFSRSLTEQLSALTEALDDRATDLLTALDVLADDVSAAIPSFLGLTMTLLSDGHPIMLTAIEPDDAATVRASLQLPLRSLVGATGTVLFYARNAGAFVDLAEDTRRIFGLDGQVVVDGHLPDLTDSPGAAGISGLTDLSVVNRAIGVLIDHGFDPAQARTELRRIAAADGGSLPAASRTLLAAIPPVAGSGPLVADAWQPSDPSGLG